MSIKATQPGPDYKLGNRAIGILEAIERAMQDSTPSEILDENSPLRDEIRSVVETAAGRAEAQRKCKRCYGNPPVKCGLCGTEPLTNRAPSAQDGLDPSKPKAITASAWNCDCTPTRIRTGNKCERCGRNAPTLDAALATPSPQPAEAKTAAVDGMTDAEIYAWWASENGLEDCNMCKLDDFRAVVRAVEKKLAAIATQERT